MKVFFKLFLIILCTACNPNSREAKYETTFSKANLSRITERLQVMIFELGTHDESKEFILDSVTGYVEKMTVYDKNAKATLYYQGTAMGFMQYSLCPKDGYMPFSEEYCKYECKIDKDENYIIDIASPKPGRTEYEQGLNFVIDTIRDFVIIPKDKIILSKDDYDLLQNSKDGKESGKRYILYRYE